MRNAQFVAGVIGLLCISASCAAVATPSQWMAGTEFSTGTSYVYLGHVTALPGSSLGNGYVKRLWIDWSKYRYDKSGQNYEVSAPGAELALGFQRASENHWWAAFAGLTYRHTSLSPADPMSSISGNKINPKWQIEGEQTLGHKWRLSAIGSYVTGQQGYWTRARVLHDNLPGMQIGLESIAQGDPNYHANQYGILLLGLKANNTVNVGLKAGIRKVAGLNSHTYFGVELGGMY